MLNDRYKPTSEYEEEILDVLRHGGRLRPSHIYEDMGVERSTAHHYLDRLVAAGWVANPRGGLYEFAYDPREMTRAEVAAVHREWADHLEQDRDP